MPLLKKILLITGAIVAIVILVIGIALYATSSVTDAIKNQLTALKMGNITKAYSYTSKDFQATTSLENFEKFILNYSSLKDNESASFIERKVDNGTGIVRGILYSKSGASTPIEYRLIKEK